MIKIWKKKIKIINKRYLNKYNNYYNNNYNNNYNNCKYNGINCVLFSFILFISP